MQLGSQLLPIPPKSFLGWDKATRMEQGRGQRLAVQGVCSCLSIPTSHKEEPTLLGPPLPHRLSHQNGRMGGE